jgi:2-(1,2-epoxy-1,2-dihydrophenyl)acetyl-CoA isomerase
MSKDESSATDASPLLVHVDDGIARLTLNRPARLNAFDAELAAAWAAGVDSVIARDDVRAIIVDATGPAFCAGGDVLSMASGIGSAAALEELAGVINRGITALVASSIPVVAAAHGTTAGGGLGILLASDYAIVGEDSKIGSRYASMGLTPDLSVTAQLARAVGERRALQLVLQERLLPAAEAHAWGLVAEVVAPDQVKARALEVARGWVDTTPWAYGQAKRLVRAAPVTEWDAQLADEARTIGAAFETPEAQARIAAFAAASTRAARS